MSSLTCLQTESLSTVVERIVNNGVRMFNISVECGVLQLSLWCIFTGVYVKNYHAEIIIMKYFCGEFLCSFVEQLLHNH